MIQVRCPKCDAVYPAGQDHKCAKADRVAGSPNSVVTSNPVVTANVTMPVVTKTPVTTPIVTPVTTSVVTKPAKSGSERVKRWREANREHYNTYMRKYRRAARKAQK